MHRTHILRRSDPHTALFCHAMTAIAQPIPMPPYPKLARGGGHNPRICHHFAGCLDGGRLVLALCVAEPSAHAFHVGQVDPAMRAGLAAFRVRGAIAGLAVAATSDFVDAWFWFDAPHMNAAILPFEDDSLHCFGVFSDRAFDVHALPFMGNAYSRP